MADIDCYICALASAGFASAGLFSAAHESHTQVVLESSSSENRRSASLVWMSSLMSAAKSQIGLMASFGSPTLLVKRSSFSLSGMLGLPRYSLNLLALLGGARALLAAELHQALLENPRVIGLALGNHADAGLDAIGRAYRRPRGECLAAVSLARADLVEKAHDGRALVLVGLAESMEAARIAIGRQARRLRVLAISCSNAGLR